MSNLDNCAFRRDIEITLPLVLSVVFVSRLLFNF